MPEVSFSVKIEKAICACDDDEMVLLLLMEEPDDNDDDWEVGGLFDAIRSLPHITQKNVLLAATNETND